MDLNCFKSTRWIKFKCSGHAPDASLCCWSLDRADAWCAALRVLFAVCVVVCVVRVSHRRACVRVVEWIPGDRDASHLRAHACAFAKLCSRSESSTKSRRKQRTTLPLTHVRGDRTHCRVITHNRHRTARLGWSALSPRSERTRRSRSCNRVHVAIDELAQSLPRTTELTFFSVARNDNTTRSIGHPRAI